MTVTEQDVGVAPWWSPTLLRVHAGRPAVLTARRSVSYAELADLVEERAAELGVGRRLVALRIGPFVDDVVTLLAALHRGDATMLVSGGVVTEPLLGRYRPDVIAGSAVVGSTAARAAIEHRSPVDEPSPHDLHPDLAMLLSTSGSTGVPKLVRLSRTNLAANASAIAHSLRLGADDRGITALPLHYCYGLSVLTSHLAAGAAVVLTDLAVVDPCFWELAGRHEVSGLATVPHSLELLERTGDELLDLGSLRYVTQAGGRLEPDRVVDWACRGHRLGWDFVVMYGQTEATARMAYLPTADTLGRPSSVGVAIPGGSISIETPRDLAGDPEELGPGVGEIVYRGPNVMMGYAEQPADLARGAELDELRTGDLGRLDDDGFLHVVGRTSRFVKIHGKRVDLDQAAASIGSMTGARIVVAGDDEGLAVVRVDAEHHADHVSDRYHAPDLDGDADGRGAGAVACVGDDTEVDSALRVTAASVLDLPPGRIVGVRMTTLPRTSSGKIDRAALLDAARSAGAGPSGSDGSQRDDSVRAVFESVLARTDLDDGESFASLGGDSFSYVETSIRLEALLHRLPTDWHVRPIAELEAMRPAGERRRRGVQVETSVVLRAVCILLIVCTHMRLYRLPGGAHTLLAVVGYNFARFQLPSMQLAGRVRRTASTIARIAVPTSAWIGINVLLVGGYSLGALLLVNNYTGDAARRGGRWEYWYFEAFVQTMVVLAILFSIGVVRRAERRAPFAFALAVLAATLAIRFDVVQWGGEYNEMFRTHAVAVFVALGWAAFVAREIWQRALVTVIAVVAGVGYFGQTDREWRIILFVAALIWLPTIRLPKSAVPVVTTIAAASMWIFLVHWQVWPLFTPWLERHVAFAATIAVGVGVWWTYERLRRAWASAGGLDGPGQRLRRAVGRSTSSQVSEPDTATRASDARPVSA